MKELSRITAGFVDCDGMYLPLAERLARDYGRVLYADTGEEAMDTVNRAVIGDSFPENERLERVDDILLRKSEIDLWIFPDSKCAGLQLFIEEDLKKPVWGSRRGSMVEHSREAFLDILDKMGLKVPKFKRVVGIRNLSDYLEDKEDQIIKISKYRGTMETKKWRSWDEDEAWLDYMAVRLGGLKNIWPFLVFESIDTPLELGGDTYNVRGRFPRYMMDGYEYKDKGYFGAFKPVSDMPEPTQAVMQEFAPILEYFGFINFWSMEIRVKGDAFYFIDPTPRGPLPGGATQSEIYSNLAEIVTAGAEGELVEPKPAALYSAECVLTMSVKPPQMASVRIPQPLQQWVKLGGACKINGRSWFPELHNDHGDEIGWMVALGDSPKEVIERMLGFTELLPDGVTAHTESLVDLLREIATAEEKGIQFTPLKLPKPEFVVQADE